MNFKPFDEEAKKLISKYTLNNGYKGSDYSYNAFLSWFDDIEYAHESDVLYIRVLDGGILKYMLPVFNKQMGLEEALDKLPPDSILAFVTKPQKEELAHLYASYKNRDWAEYIYASDEFINLTSKKLHSKRNFRTRFLSNYSKNYAMEKLRPEDYSEISQLEEKWALGQNCPREQKQTIEKEGKLLSQWLDESIKGNLICDVLRIDGELVGCAIGEKMPNGNAVEMYEKANIDYIGIYTFLATEFAKRNFSDCRYINRQDDVGNEGLRQSKKSYSPKVILDKYVLFPRDIVAKEKEEDKTERDVLATMLIDFNEPINYDEKKLVTKVLEYKHYNTVMAFLKYGIKDLEDKKWFMNYTDEELASALKNGHFLGTFIDNKLVSTCCIDFDKEYGDKLKEICNDKSNKRYYELSGIMTHKSCQGRGLSKTLISTQIEYARKRLQGAVLCAVVQYDNEPSLNNLKQHGFKEVAGKEYKEYKFKYLTLAI